MENSLAKPVVAEQLDQLAANPDLDRLADVITPYAEQAQELFGGIAEGEGTTGTPLHPALVHFPIGGAFSAALLDLVGMRLGAGLVTAFTAASALPTAVTGLANYAEEADDPQGRRIGAAHGAVAAAGTTLTVLSLLARFTGQRGFARTALWGACAAYAGAGLLGGHLVYGLEYDDEFENPVDREQVTEAHDDTPTDDIPASDAEL